MTKNTARIITGLRALVRQPHEVASGVVTAIDDSLLTIDVLLCGEEDPVKGVMLNTLINDVNGLILFPKVGSNVVIASVDGPGMWCLVKVNEITKAQVTIEQVVYTMDSTQVNIKNGNVVFNMSDSVFKMKTQNESLFDLLNDCFNYLSQLTVPTPAGMSSVPTQAQNFMDLKTRLNNLLNA